MRKVYKYAFKPAPTASIAMPAGAKILRFDMQYDMFCLWALVDPDSAVTETRKFIVAGTGNPIDETTISSYIGTAMVQDGQFVFHCFETI